MHMGVSGLSRTRLRVTCLFVAITLALAVMGCGREAPRGLEVADVDALDGTEKGEIVAPPPPGYIYHSVFPGGVTGEEDDLTPGDLTSYEQTVGKEAAWVYFSHNWYKGRSFPLETATWIREAGCIPFIRLMLRSSPALTVPEPTFTLERIAGGQFDPDLRAWARSARDFGTPLIAEYGTEVNGEWFSWNGIWNGEAAGAQLFRDAYRRIINIAREEGATNITWVFHVNNRDIPDEPWNRLENYYPGDEWIDWIGVSVYGALKPSDGEFVSLREAMDEVYPRVTALNAITPIVLLEFGVTSGNPHVNQAAWARNALRDITGARGPRLIGFSWWNERWSNDGDPARDTNMRVQDNAALAAVFARFVGAREEVLGRAMLEGR
jgi:hypothetical protein